MNGGAPIQPPRSRYPSADTAHNAPDTSGRTVNTTLAVREVVDPVPRPATGHTTARTPNNVSVMPDQGWLGGIRSAWIERP